MHAGIKRWQKRKETEQSDGSYLKCPNNPTAWNLNERKLEKEQRKSDGTKRRHKVKSAMKSAVTKCRQFM